MFKKSVQEIKKYSLICVKFPIDSEFGSILECTCCTRKAVAFTEIFDRHVGIAQCAFIFITFYEFEKC